MNFRRGYQREEPELNLVPLIDVMMVILIFLMISTTYSKYTELQINLPTADTEKQLERPNEINVLVNASGQYVVNKVSITFSSVQALADDLRRAGGAQKDPIIVISADATATHQSVIRIMEAARVAGYPQITFTTVASSRRRTAAIVAQALARHWQRRSALAWLLLPASWLFGAVVVLRRLAYALRLVRRHRAGIPLVVVGNLSVGGSGKTPLVLWIAEHLRKNGYRPGIVSRGHGGHVEAPREASIASSPDEVGDEPILLARRSGCPVWVAPDRVAAARALRAAHPDCDVLLSDDGLQHYALARDLEIAVVDARGFGNGFLLPAGPLREPASRLRSVDAVVAHDTSAVSGFAMRLAGTRFVQMLDARNVVGAEALRGKPVHAVAGIGDPERFFRQIERLGLAITRHPFEDHYPFQAGDLQFGDAAPVVMTEKDAVKCKRFARPEFWIFPVSAELDPAFGRWLLERLALIHGRPATA